VSQSLGHYSVKRVSNTLSLTHGAGVNTVTNTAIPLNGLLYSVNTLTPAAVDGAATATINILDSDGTTVYTKAALAANTKTADKPATYPTPLSGNYQVQVVFSANQTATDSVTTVVLLIQAV
jgi:hypothetical protein